MLEAAIAAGRLYRNYEYQHIGIHVDNDKEACTMATVNTIPLNGKTPSISTLLWYNQNGIQISVGLPEAASESQTELQQKDRSPRRESGRSWRLKAVGRGRIAEPVIGA